MRIIHSARDRDFTRLPIAFAQDGRLTHMARGCMTELWSRSDGAEVTAEVMWQESVESHGKHSPSLRQFEAVYAELREYGYLRDGDAQGEAK
ncbi:hypothetical protein [Embleya sp. NPDC001921]